jgi:cysteine synthase A
MHTGVLSTIGNTPLVKLERLLAANSFDLYAKLESFNPAGSMKDRAALSVIKHGIEAGLIKPDTVIVESSSGNMGIGLAQACSSYNLRFICVVDPKATRQNINIIRAYGAEIDMVMEPDATTGEFLQARLTRVGELQRTIVNSYWPNQYANYYNAVSHHETMREIIAELGEGIDFLFCATSTCGTLRGCADFIRDHEMRTKIIAVDAVGSVIFDDEKQKQKRLITGHGASVRPSLFRPGMAERCVLVTDLECIVGCRRLVRREAILAGGSTGAIVATLERVKENIPAHATCVAIFPDRGERYLDTIYSDAWVAEHFGEVSHMWQQPRENESCEMVM